MLTLNLPAYISSWSKSKGGAEEGCTPGFFGPWGSGMLKCFSSLRADEYPWGGETATLS